MEHIRAGVVMLKFVNAVLIAAAFAAMAEVDARSAALEGRRPWPFILRHAPSARTFGMTRQHFCARILLPRPSCQRQPDAAADQGQRRQPPEQTIVLRLDEDAAAVAGDDRPAAVERGAE